jgi:aldehyde:ferredoxin oxidoreductase
LILTACAVIESYGRGIMGDGYMGRVLWVDLSKNHIWDEHLNDDIKSYYIGGYGIALKILLSRQKKGANPLHKDSICGVMTGPLTGSGSAIGSQFTVFGKSPLTGTWGDANSGGCFGPQLKRAGYDGVFVTGSSEKPVYILIDEGKASIKDAKQVWGKTTYETENFIKAEVGKDVQVACISSSGEKCNRFAAIIIDRERAAARFGLGAQWGSKKLKAIAVRGSIQVKVADEKRLAKLRKKYISQIIKDQVGPSTVYQYGTPGYTVDGALNGAMAFVVECYGKGLLTEKDTGGPRLICGNYRTIIELTEQIALCDGLVKVQAEGLKAAAEALEFCAPFGLEEATIWFGTEKDNLVKGENQLKVLECLCNVVNVSGSCLLDFLSTTSEVLGEFLSAVTGRKWTKEELIQVGERISNLRQLFNLREGANPIYAYFPERALGELPLKKSPTVGFSVNMFVLMEEYLKQMSRTNKRVPTIRKPESLNIEGMSAEL